LNRAILSQRISSILDDTQRLNNALYAMNTTDIQRYPDNYEVLSTDAALRAEQITCRLRHLIYATTRINAGEYLLSASATQGIEIGAADGIIEITLPGLLPKRKPRQSSEFLLDPFNAALGRYVQEHPVPRFRHCAVCFCSVYDRALPKRRIRDYDNLELKQLLDVAAAYLLVDDSGILCDTYNTTELGDTDCTRIVIMESTQFPAWMNERQATLEPVQNL